MVEVRYRDCHEVADIAGKSLADVCKGYKTKFGIPDKAIVKLNDRKLKRNQESVISLRDSDKVHFAEAKVSKGALMLGALLVALAITGGTFAYGYASSTGTLTNVLSTGGDFAGITAASGQPSWKVWGSSRGTIGSGNLFIVNTSTTNYTGNLGVTVSIANGDQLVKVYRALNLFISAMSSNGSAVDINADNVTDSNDYALLTLDNGSVDLYINQFRGSDNYTVRVKNGYYISNIQGLGWPSGAHQPIMYAQVFQR